MPSEPKGFLFRYLDKLLAAIVFLAVVGMALYAFQRTSMQDDPRDRIAAVLESVEQLMDVDPPDPPGTNWVELMAARGVVAAQGALRPTTFWWPIPEVYLTKTVGLNQLVRLEFTEPLEEDRVQVLSEKARIATIKGHPVGGDYTVVEVRTGETEGIFRVVGWAGERRHIQPVVVDKDVGQSASPPLDLKATGEHGLIQVSFRPNPKNVEGNVDISEYEIYRKEARDVFGDYEPVGNVTVKRELGGGIEAPRELERGRGARRSYSEREATLRGREAPRRESVPVLRVMPGAGAMRPGGPTGVRSRTTEASEDLVRWEDDYVWPGETYLYKVRVRAPRSHPPLSEFTEPVEAVALSDIDFRLVRGRPNPTIEVAKLSGGGGAAARTFEVVVGDEIGAWVEDVRTGRYEDFRTGCVLLAYHPRVFRMKVREIEVGGQTIIRETPTSDSRIVYIDIKGNVQMRWKKEVAVEAIWEKVGEEPRPGMGREGVPMPMPMLPGGGFEELSPYGRP